MNEQEGPSTESLAEIPEIDITDPRYTRTSRPRKGNERTGPREIGIVDRFKLNTIDSAHMEIAKLFARLGSGDIRFEVIETHYERDATAFDPLTRAPFVYRETLNASIRTENGDEVVLKVVTQEVRRV